MQTNADKILKQRSLRGKFAHQKFLANHYRHDIKKSSQEHQRRIEESAPDYDPDIHELVLDDGITDNY